jgi:hypothetical protein
MLIILMWANACFGFFFAALTSVFGFSEVGIAYDTKHGMMCSMGP